MPKMIKSPKKTKSSKETPTEHIIAKLQDVLVACTTLKARIDIIEDHLVFLLTKSPDYQKLMETKNATEQPIN